MPLLNQREAADYLRRVRVAPPNAHCLALDGHGEPEERYGNSMVCG